MKTQTRIQAHIDRLSKDLDKALNEVGPLIRKGDLLHATDKLSDAHVIQNVIANLRWVLDPDTDTSN